MLDAGLSWREVGGLTVRQHRALYAQMKRQPPTHWLLAAFIGWKAPATSDPRSDVDIRDLFEAIPGAAGSKSLTVAMLPLLGML